MSTSLLKTGGQIDNQVKQLLLKRFLNPGNALAKASPPQAHKPHSGQNTRATTNGKICPACSLLSI
ncbi:MAG: hypothetical protein GX168_09360 [Bacteroidales bacterium]|nr:hypothetical protein [Bacteroidales bacterium]